MNSEITIHSVLRMRESWATLAEEISAGRAGQIITVGDKITFTLKNGNEVAVTAVADSPYWENSVAFCFDDCLMSGEMNDLDTNLGGWSQCKARKTCSDVILPVLPDDLASVIAPRTIRQEVGERTYESTDNLWLPSNTEVFGYDVDYADIDHGDVQFEYFKIQKNRVKMLGDDTAPWFLRSVHYNLSNYFRYVTSNGASRISNAHSSLGLAPAFILGPNKPPAHESERTDAAELFLPF